MPWTIEYYEQEDGTQPAEVFADKMNKTPARSKLMGKLTAYVISLSALGQDIGRSYTRPCAGFGGLWEIFVTDTGQTAYQFYGFSGDQIILLDGAVVTEGKNVPKSRRNRAFNYWLDYRTSMRISPERAEPGGEEAQ